MYESSDGKNHETFPHIPDEPSKPRNFSPSKLLSFTVVNGQILLYYALIKLEASLLCWNYAQYFTLLIIL